MTNWTGWQTQTFCTRRARVDFTCQRDFFMMVLLHLPSSGVCSWWVDAWMIFIILCMRLWVHWAAPLVKDGDILAVRRSAFTDCSSHQLLDYTTAHRHYTRHCFIYCIFLVLFIIWCYLLSCFWSYGDKSIAPSEELIYLLKNWPTDLPTYLPTYLLTNQLTDRPTNFPTYQPTYLNLPTYQLTYQPTYLLTYQPAYQPTN